MGPPWDAFGSRPRKTTKRPLFGLPFWGTIFTYFLTFLMLIFCVLLKPLFYKLLAPKAPADLNFEGLWVPFGTQSQQIWKSWNCVSVWEGMRKSSFGGVVFHLVLSFSCAGFRDVFFSWFVWRFVTILRICASIGSPFLTTCCNYFDHHFQARKKWKDYFGPGISSRAPWTHLR